MALPISGPLSFSAIQSELGGTNPISISEYYGVASLPVSGAISVDNFYGQSLGTGAVELPTLLNDQTENFGLARASLDFRSDGNIVRESYSAKTWWSAAPELGIGSGYEVEVFDASGEPVQGITVGQWTSLASSVEIYIEATQPNDIRVAQFKLRIRDTATSTVQATTNCTLFASTNLFI